MKPPPVLNNSKKWKFDVWPPFDWFFYAGHRYGSILAWYAWSLVISLRATRICWFFKKRCSTRIPSLGPKPDDCPDLDIMLEWVAVNAVIRRVCERCLTSDGQSHRWTSVKCNDLFDKSWASDRISGVRQQMTYHFVRTVDHWTSGQSGTHWQSLAVSGTALHRTLNASYWMLGLSHGFSRS